MIILDGKLTKNKILKKIKEEIKENKYKINLSVILIGNNFSSEKYVNNKRKECDEVGINLKIYKFEENVEENVILKRIEELNNDDEVHGIFVQLPLPKHINVEKVIDKISYSKDVDGFTPINLGNLLLNKETISSCTPLGILRLLKEYNIDIKGKKVCVIGSSNIVGKPLVNILMNEEATVFNCNSLTKNLKEITLISDIIISATGVINLITKEMVKEGVIVIDVGINKNKENKIVGDVDFFNIKSKCSYITPVPGGVGPMTIAMLINNTYNCYLNLKK